MPNRFSLDDIERILVLKWSAMGDVAIASAGFEDIYRAFPGRRIDLNTLPPWDRLFEQDPRFSRVLAIDLRGEDGLLAPSWKWLREVRAGRYDLVIDLQSTDRSRILLGLLFLMGANIPYRAGNKPVLPYNIAPPGLPEPRNALRITQATLQALGIYPVTNHPVLHAGLSHRERAASILHERGLTPMSYAVFLPGCQRGGYLKRWGAARYAELGRYLREAGVTKILLLGGPDEVEECAAIERQCRPFAVDLCGQTEILDLIPLCEGARFIVANDTGTAHVASATGRPLVVICGPTDPRRVVPAGDQVVAVRADIACSGCYRKHCYHHSCMALVTPGKVYQVLRELVGDLPPARHETPWSASLLCFDSLGRPVSRVPGGDPSGNKRLPKRSN